ncbi:hypothetical protein LOAG_11925 [Loa loa]|uniref:Protein TsetseEP-like n=1 Tax=Loa loa TaxID=7209 RepID=A0A1I7VIJ9_LOALO|nr:hypothetical protein LOAG_11925 [Loa loa]EFO16579.2 hypothetical protein LOAG_11925 [Loa loa]
MKLYSDLSKSFVEFLTNVSTSSDTEREIEFVSEHKLEPKFVSEYEPEPEFLSEYEPEPEPILEHEPEPEHISESKLMSEQEVEPEPTLKSEYESEPELLSEPEPFKLWLENEIPSCEPTPVARDVEPVAEPGLHLLKMFKELEIPYVIKIPMITISESTPPLNSPPETPEILDGTEEPKSEPGTSVERVR